MNFKLKKETFKVSNENYWKHPSINIINLRLGHGDVHTINSNAKLTNGRNLN